MKKCILFFLLLGLFVGCEKDEDPIIYKRAFVNNRGYDFSKGEVNLDFYYKNDGEIVNWYPTEGSNPDYSEGLWWKNESDNVNYQQKHMGIVNLESVDKISLDWDEILVPLLVDNVYIVMCQDGFSKFKVLSKDNEKWEVEIEYEYTETGNFK